MGLILDTSAIIGLAERDNSETAALIAAEEELPILHIVSLGEIHAGVSRAITTGLDQRIVDARRRTLSIASECSITRTMEPAFFGAIAAEVSRKLSHNDMWIAAAAFHHQALLVTEDKALADQLQGRQFLTLPGRRIECRYVGS